ncbi:MAG: PIN domain nuclease [Nitrococcus sp.]|nr:PIN domain nuclease [Nitrococcus sp.]
MKVLVDSSVWIDHLRGVPSRETAVLDRLLEHSDPAIEHDDEKPAAELVIADLVLCEVLRGISDAGEYTAVKDILLSFEIVMIGGIDLALQAADHYRALRRRGVTVRKSIDLLIGTWCIANGCAVLHCDRDFDPMTWHLGLRAL